MNVQERYQTLVDRAVDGVLSSEDVEALLLDLGGGVHGELPPDPAHLSLSLDLFNAVRHLERDDPSYWWNQAGMLWKQEQHVEAALTYLIAAEMMEDAVAAGTAAFDDEEELNWADSARWHAAYRLLSAQRPLTAALLVHQIRDAEQRAEVEDAVRAEVPQ